MSTKNVLVQAAVLAGLALGSGQAYAICTFGGSGEPSLQAALDGMLSGNAPDVVLDCVPDGQDAAWNTIATTGEIQISIELAGNANSNEFGVYDLLTGTTRRIFEGADSTGATATVRFAWNASAGAWRVRWREETDAAGTWEWQNLSTSAFGFYLRSAAQGVNFYSQTWRNTDGLDHMYAYRGNGAEFSGGVFAGDLFLPSDHYLAWDDTQAPGGDRDYQDFVLLMRDFSIVTPTPVPLPPAAWLLMSGLIGLAGVARRKT